MGQDDKKITVIQEELMTYFEQSPLCIPHRSSKCTLSEAEIEDRSAPPEVQNRIAEESSAPPEEQLQNRTDTAPDISVSTCALLAYPV